MVYFKITKKKKNDLEEDDLDSFFLKSLGKQYLFCPSEIRLLSGKCPSVNKIFHIPDNGTLVSAFLNGSILGITILPPCPFFSNLIQST